MLLLVFVMMVLGLFALFLGGGLVAQGYLYQQPADRLPLRALAGAIMVGGYVTLWVWIDRGAPEKYDILFNFRGESKVELTEFEAVRWASTAGKISLDASGNPIETTVKFKRAGKEGPFLEGGTGAPFELTGWSKSAKYMTGALRVKGPGENEPIRYNAKLNEDRTYPTKDVEGIRFFEEKGSRYVKAGELGALYVPSTGTVVVALLLNVMLFGVWQLALWPIMRFSLGHSLMFTAVLGVITLLGLMPVLFKPNRAPKALPAPVTTQVGSIPGYSS